MCLLDQLVTPETWAFPPLLICLICICTTFVLSKGARGNWVSLIELQEVDSAADACGLAQTGSDCHDMQLLWPLFNSRVIPAELAGRRTAGAGAKPAVLASPLDTAPTRPRAPLRGSPTTPSSPLPIPVHPKSVSGHTLFTPTKLLLNASPSKNGMKLPQVSLRT